MTKRIVFGVAVVALAVLVMAPSASAACGGIRNATTFGSAVSYWQSPTVAGVVVGQTWQLGAPGAWSTGNCNTVQAGAPGPGFLYFTGTDLSLNLDLAACGAGCPANASTLAVLAQNRTPAGTEFLLATIVETPANPSANFDFGSQGNHAMIPIPRPRVLSSSRVGDNVILSIALDSIAGGLYGPNAASAVTGFRIVGKSTTSDPGAAAASYDAVPRVAVVSAGGAATTTPLTVSCLDSANDQYIATQIVFEGGAVLGDSVSASTRIKCIPALANPTPKVKVAPKKGIATN